MQAKPETFVSVLHNVSFEVIADFYLISLLCIVGIFGNIVSVIVLQRDKERREALFLLQGLAVADAGYLVVALLRYPLKYLLVEKENYDLMQPYVFPLLKTFQTVTIWMMVLVTVDRFTCVCRPFRSQRFFTGRTRRWYAVTTFVAGAAYNVPRFLDSCVMKWVDLCSSTVSTRMVYTSTFNNTLYYDIYLYGLYIYMLYIGPLFILAFMNFRLIRAIKASRRLYRNQHVSGTSGNNKATTSTAGGACANAGDTCSDNNATFVLIVIVLVFIVCETPELILKIITVIQRHFHYDLFSETLLRFNIISQLLMVINSSVNFFVYIFFGRRFRHILNDTFKFPFKFSSNGSATTRETVPLQFHHNCIHAPRNARRQQMI